MKKGPNKNPTPLGSPRGDEYSMSGVSPRTGSREDTVSSQTTTQMRERVWKSAQPRDVLISPGSMDGPVNGEVHTRIPSMPVTPSEAVPQLPRASETMLALAPYSEDSNRSGGAPSKIKGKMKTKNKMPEAGMPPFEITVTAPSVGDKRPEDKKLTDSRQSEQKFVNNRTHSQDKDSLQSEGKASREREAKDGHAHNGLRRVLSPSKGYINNHHHHSPSKGVEDPLIHAVRSAVRAEMGELLAVSGRFRDLLRTEVSEVFETFRTGKAHNAREAVEQHMDPTMSKSLQRQRTRRGSFKEVSFAPDTADPEEFPPDSPTKSQSRKDWPPKRSSVRSGGSESLSDSEREGEDQAKEYFSEIVRSMSRHEGDREASNYGDIKGRFSCTEYLDMAYDYFLSIQEPRRRGCLASVVSSRAFETIILITIFVNCGFMAYSADHDVQSPGETNSTIVIGDWIFQIIYTIELSLKLIVHRQFFFCNDSWKANWFDAFLVIVGWMGMTGDSEGGGFSGSFLRVVRLAKLGRTMRAVRAMSELKHLRAFLVCLQGSFMSFFWSLVMLVAVLIIFSLFMVQILGAYLLDNDIEIGSLETMDRMYGTVARSTLTLFRASTGGDDWAIPYDVIVEVGVSGAIVYLVFISFTQLALINIITGIFVESAVQTLRPDRETIATEHLRLEKENAMELERLCKMADRDGNGRLGRKEFEDSLHKDRIRRLLMVLGLSKYHVMEFFDTMSTLAVVDEGEVDISQFVRGCMQLKGAATNFDVQMIHAELRSMWNRQERRLSELNGQILHLTGLCDLYGSEVDFDSERPDLDGHSSS